MGWIECWLHSAVLKADSPHMYRLACNPCTTHWGPHSWTRLIMARTTSVMVCMMSRSGCSPEKRCRLGGPAVRLDKRPVKDPPDRPPKEEPLVRTKLPSLDGNSSPSSDVSRWLAANVCKHIRVTFPCPKEVHSAFQEPLTKAVTT